MMVTAPSPSHSITSVWYGNACRVQTSHWTACENSGAYRTSSHPLVAPPKPALAFDVVAVGASCVVDGRAVALDGSAEFAYAAPAEVYRADPPRGPDGGGSLVTLVGSGFPNGADLACVFGDRPVAAVRTSPTTVDCATPRHPYPQVVPVTLTVGGLAALSSTATFRYGPATTAFRATPARAPHVGLWQHRCVSEYWHYFKCRALRVVRVLFFLPFPIMRSSCLPSCARTEY